MPRKAPKTPKKQKTLALVAGSLATGFKVYGPFASFDDAIDFEQFQLEDEEGRFTVPLIDPSVIPLPVPRMGPDGKKTLHNKFVAKAS